MNIVCVLGYKTESLLSSKTIHGLLYVNPPMALLNSSSETCKKHSHIFLRELEKLTLWALKSK